MSDKVKLPKDIAEILGSFSEWGIETLFQEIIGHNRIHPETSQITKLHEFFSGRWTFLAESLINGYEVERNPEEHLLEMFKEACQKEIVGNNEDWWQGRRMGIIDTLNTLGIKIKGINP